MESLLNERIRRTLLRSPAITRMVGIGTAVIAAVVLLGCSGNERDAKHQPISFDKTEIDLTQSDPYSWPLSQRTNWHITLLAKIGPEDEAVRWNRLKTMQGKPAKITDRGEVLASGHVAGVTESQGRYLGPIVAFPSSEVADELFIAN